MFISVKFLHESLGIDPEIARFFVDRKVPKDNAFWKDRLLYVSFGNGFISIPIFYDLMYRIGVPRDALLREPHVQFMEWIMDVAHQVEKGVLTYAEQLEKIKDRILSNPTADHAFFWELMGYLVQDELKPMGRLGTDVPALNRADVFLFVLCDLPLLQEQKDQAIDYTQALLGIFLLMDDIIDYDQDQGQGEENAVAQLGGGQAGLDRAMGWWQSAVRTLEGCNPLLAQHLTDRSESLYKKRMMARLI